MSVTVSAPMLARGWLAVHQATGADGTSPQLHKTVCVDQYTHGLRLTATDSYMLLTTWIPEAGYELDEQPGLDEVPYATAVAHDPHGRGTGLLAHLLNLAKADKEKVLDLDVVVQLNVPWQADTGRHDLQLEGLSALAVTLEHPESERVQLKVYDGGYVRWQSLLAEARPIRGATGVAVSQWIAGRLAKAAKPHGDGTPLRLRFGGSHKPIYVAFGDDPEVTGLVMPLRWDFDRDAPWEPPGADQTDDDPRSTDTSEGDHP